MPTSQGIAAHPRRRALPVGQCHTTATATVVGLKVICGPWCPRRKRQGQSRAPKCARIPFSRRFFCLIGTPAAGNSNLFFFGPFWAFGTERNSGPGRKTQKHNLPVLGGTFWGGNPAAQKVSPRNSATFEHVMSWPTGTPRVETCETSQSR